MDHDINLHHHRRRRDDDNCNYQENLSCDYIFKNKSYDIISCVGTSNHTLISDPPQVDAENHARYPSLITCPLRHYVNHPFAYTTEV